ncbi:MAG: dihydrolipoyl dehydrogenase [Alphaproteobacteria bacterium]|nr:dihydrolipoyl dehydrogenase [Alphaproteobacteria bacterium]
MSDDSFDVVVIGAGPGGYVCAIRAAQLGMRVACVESRKTLGGTCLNVGCIPSKALLHSSEAFAHAAHGLETLGVKTGKVTLDLKRMLAHKDGIVEQTTKGVDYLFKKNKIERVLGKGRLAGLDTVHVDLEGGGTRILKAKRIVLATGSVPAGLPNVPIDEERIVTSTGALALAEVPETLIVIGGGYIGLEMGSVWARLGSKVTVVEFLDRIVPGMDGEVAKAFQRVLQKQGFEFRLGTKVTGAKAGKDGVSLTVEAAAGGKAETLKAAVVLVAVGRKPYTDGLGLAEAGVKLDKQGRIEVNEHYQTAVPSILAIGDCIKGPMLAHKASDEGVAVAELIAGQAGHVNYDVIPGVVYTWPEVASVGKTEEELKAAGIAYKVGKFPFSAHARARASGNTEGFVKVLADAATDRVLGAHMIGPDVGTMIVEAATVMEFGGSAEDIARICHPHPTLTEVVREAALAVGGGAIHI